MKKKSCVAPHEVAQAILSATWGGACCRLPPLRPEAVDPAARPQPRPAVRRDGAVCRPPSWRGPPR